VLTRIPDSWAWMRPDLLVRLMPFAIAFGVACAWSGGAGWLGLGPGNLTVQLRLTRRRGTLLIPAGADDAWFQAAFYVLNGPLEEGFFRGLVQGGIGITFVPPVGLVIATSAYVLYHRLGRWTWPETLATALVGVPLGLAFWLLPGPPSLLGVSVAHIAATCGFLGPGPYLLRKLKLV